MVKGGRRSAIRYAECGSRQGFRVWTSGGCECGFARRRRREVRRGGDNAAAAATDVGEHVKGRCAVPTAGNSLGRGFNDCLDCV